MADIAPPPVPPKLKPIIKHWASYAGPTASSSRSSSTSADDDLSVPTIPHEIHTMRSMSSLPTRPPSPATLQNIKFAPLPHIEPRRRKSNVRLGVAARSRMIAARRGQLPPDWNDEPASTEERPPNGPLVEDPFEIFGRYVLVKSKNLWRRVSPKAPAPPAVVVGEVPCDPELSTDQPATTDSEKAEGVSSVSLEAAQTDEMCRRSRDKEDAGGVWEEEINSEAFKQRMARVSATPRVDQEAKKARRISLIRRDSPPVEA